MNNEYKIAQNWLNLKTWAVVGANNNPQKYGNIIYKRLKSAGFQVYPVNPLYSEVDGDVCYPDLTSLPTKPDVIDMVVTPKRGYSFIDEAVKLGVSNFWFQPGTHDDELIDYAEKKGIQSIQACVLVSLVGR